MSQAVDKPFDVVVVGSGFGGSVIALRLAEAGRSVLVLERGQPYPPGSFPRTPHGMRGNFWSPSDSLYGLFDLWSFTGLDVVVSSGLGGGSLIYANVMLRKPPDTFFEADPGDELVRPWPVTRAELDPHYDRVKAMQRPARFPMDAGGPYAAVRRTKAMFEAADQMGLECRLPPLAIAFAAGDDPPRPGAPLIDDPPNLHGAPRSTCRLCGECDMGCNFGAKNTLDFTYLSAAHRAGALLRCCCEVTTIAPAADDGGGYEVGYRQHVPARDGHPAHLLDPDEARQTAVVRARRVVLAAGAVGTTRLLLTNRISLPGLSPALGTHVSGNGDALAFVRNCAERDEHGHPRRDADGQKRWRYLDPSAGPVITASIHVPADRSRSGRPHQLQDAGAPAFSEWMWQALELPGDLWAARGTLAHRMLARLRGRRQTHLSPLASELLGTAHASAAMMPMLAMGRDTPNGRYRLNGDQLELDWSPEASDPYLAGVNESFGRFAKAVGGEFDPDPLARLNRGVTVHPLGGCPMDSDARRGVTDAWGRVHGHPGLYVADGALLPGPVGPNPSFTIAALADRVADGIEDEAR